MAAGLGKMMGSWGNAQLSTMLGSWTEPPDDVEL